MFEARPDIFPQGYLTDVEMEVWGFYYQERNQQVQRNG